MSLYFKDHYSLKYYRLWDYFRTRQTDNKLYVLINTIVNEDNILIGYEVKEKQDGV